MGSPHRSRAGEKASGDQALDEEMKDAGRSRVAVHHCCASHGNGCAGADKNATGRMWLALPVAYSACTSWESRCHRHRPLEIIRGCLSMTPRKPMPFLYPLQLLSFRLLRRHRHGIGRWPLLLSRRRRRLLLAGRRWRRLLLAGRRWRRLLFAGRGRRRLLLAGRRRRRLLLAGRGRR